MAYNPGGGSGSVTSVSGPAEMSIANPTTTPTISWASQAANKILAAPSGSAGAMTARLLATADIPDISGTYLTVSAASAGYQPLDADLTAIAALATTAFGRGFLDLADDAAARTKLTLGTLATQSGTFSGTTSGTNTGDQTITLTGDVTGSGTGSFATTVAKITTTTGPTSLTIGSVADGEYLQRSGTTIIGATPAGGSGITLGLALASAGGGAMPGISGF